MDNDADTCRTLIPFRFQAAGRDGEPHSIAGQRYFADCRIVSNQLRIVAEVERRSSVEEEFESVVSVNPQRAVRLRQSVLQKAFTGELG